jgi:hypothetical protein
MQNVGDPLRVVLLQDALGAGVTFQGLVEHLADLSHGCVESVPRAFLQLPSIDVSQVGLVPHIFGDTQLLEPMDSLEN